MDIDENLGKHSKEPKNSKITIIVILILILVALIAVSWWAYAKYLTTAQGTATVKTAEMICEMDIVSSEKTDSIINPYCTVTVMDYKNDSITETDVEYTIDVTPKDADYVLPEFAWKNSAGTIIARSVDVTDENNQIIARTATFPQASFSNGVKEDHVYTIVFFNTGEEELSKKVNFKLNAIQGMSE